MEDKRKFKRLPVNINLNIKSLYKCGDKTLNDINEDVTVINISRSGIGFISKREFPIGYYFNAKVTIDEEKIFYSVLKIVRCQRINNGFTVGCEFVGLADILSEVVEDYEHEIFSK
ncbi:PilZ domain-containing protein [Caminicella sporogenes DSM 14501]|uniref:PilZ domain-containing protein n=1 Tax=Caminicella sporogenes DSM 14501 TaxID=1121266 RepID=A0A1M6N4U1_9FIRM|nr:PilZ domain-containing protein [Caminicella sporogenes]RKD22361.1 hypothetical protein BET04_04825 [Caminicella sporogenes]WIF95187.1 PilZ domain-containing protein [Caminicella sporogenes]SHJ90745.1 PilZ domain-containing protein [Caminicella sporogenes DSM 14501]